MPTVLWTSTFVSLTSVFPAMHDNNCCVLIIDSNMVILCFCSFAFHACA